jgi:hypothetical protein
MKKYALLVVLMATIVVAHAQIAFNPYAFYIEHRSIIMDRYHTGSDFEKEIQNYNYESDHHAVAFRDSIPTVSCLILPLITKFENDFYNHTIRGFTIKEGLWLIKSFMDREITGRARLKKDNNYYNFFIFNISGKPVVIVVFWSKQQAWHICAADLDDKRYLSLVSCGTSLTNFQIISAQ